MPKQCRYYEYDIGNCAYWDMPLRGNEDILCYPGGWECYDSPNGIIYEGAWLKLEEALDKYFGVLPEG